MKYLIQIFSLFIFWFPYIADGTTQSNKSFHPFEPVKLILGNNYSFLDLGSNYAANKEMVVPAILAALYIQKIRSNATQHNLRQVGNVAAITAAIAATPLTGGGSLPLGQRM
jgi:hypothetical protein